MKLILIISLLVLSIILVGVKPSEITYMTSYCPNTTSDYTEGSKFQFNLNRLLYRLLYNNASQYSIYANPSVGENDDDKFMDCISVEETFHLKTAQNTGNYMVKGISDAMFDNLTPKATNDLKYAESFDEITPLSLSQKLYGMVQCIPDLSAEDCRACLKGARSVIPKSIPRECRVVHESCHLSYQFKNPDEGRAVAPPPPSPTPGDCLKHRQLYESFSWMNQVKGIADAMFDNLNQLLYRLICVGENDNDKVHEMYLCRVENAPRDCQNCTDAQITGDYLCIPDLSAEDCRACLKGARSVIPKSVPRECRVVHESCHLSYQLKNPEEGRTGAPPPPSPTPGDKDQGWNDLRDSCTWLRLLVEPSYLSLYQLDP
ncbi:hypothetical protein KY290_019889 [Solanum tuberosum]|uniref:Gnk2-homologous domain-containing protein n=1 Tax=Solanum tuberosum TaxID=4113 RepID=A0ABQ7VIM0_SOLTU|nr:hypothetical protein KY284_018786 [Solanum tuberosum]KAH0690265.1 hypothetical protein KY289_017623 [Solanum tuberosum]KAH0763816.1 hypothetical protein KY290_019889 [Solanum tuberosum]